MTSVIHKVKITIFKCKKEIKYRIFKKKSMHKFKRKKNCIRKTFKAPTNMAMEFTLTLVRGIS